MPSFSKNFLFGALIIILIIISITFGMFWLRTKEELRSKDKEVSELQKHIEQAKMKITEQNSQTPLKIKQNEQLSDMSSWKTYRSEGNLKFEVKYPANWAYSDLEPMTAEDFFVCFMDEKYNFEGGECRGGPSFSLQNYSFFNEGKVRASRIFPKEDAIDDNIEINFIEGGVTFYAQCDSQIIDTCNKILSTFKFSK